MLMSVGLLHNYIYEQCITNNNQAAARPGSSSRVC